jgi:hypothetical protein
VKGGEIGCGVFLLLMALAMLGGAIFVARSDPRHLPDLLETSESPGGTSSQVLTGAIWFHKRRRHD